MNGSKPNSLAGIGRTTSRRPSRRAAPWSVSPHPGPLPLFPLSHPMGEGSGVREMGERGEGEPFLPRSTIQTFRLSLHGARCSLSLRERVRVRGNGANDPLAFRTIPGTVELVESSGSAGGFLK